MRSFVTRRPAADATPYRKSHLGSAKALEYDRDFARPESAKGLSWQLEQRLLDRVLEHDLPRAPAGALDVACGTGRVLAYLERRVERCTGVDVSPAMLAVAGERCRHAALVESDLVDLDPAQLGHPVELVTAFRFLLNAEPELRTAALRWIHSALPREGRLVANFHLNPNSIRGAYLRVRGLRSSQPMISPGQARDLLDRCGFAVERCYGYEFLPFRRAGTSLAWPRLRKAIELSMLGRRRASPIAGAFLLVARPIG